MTLYTDNDQAACGWLRELVKADQISAGDVDARPIAEIRPHLWPDMRRLIAECQPPTVFGEQVASRLGREWLAGVRADMEALGYRFGAADLCAAGVASPHIRQRLFWVAESESVRAGTREQGVQEAARLGRGGSANGDGLGGLANSDGGKPGNGRLQPSGEHGQQPEDGGDSLGLGITSAKRPQGQQQARAARRPTVGARATRGLPDPARLVGHGGQHQPERVAEGRSADRRDRPWSEYVVVPCGDGKARRLKPGLSALVDGAPARVVRLRGYGNAIVPQIAAEFVKAYLAADDTGARQAGDRGPFP